MSRTLEHVTAMQRQMEMPIMIIAEYAESQEMLTMIQRVLNGMVAILIKKPQQPLIVVHLILLIHRYQKTLGSWLICRLFFVRIEI